MPRATDDPITRTLRAHGAVDEGVRLFEWDNADLLIYATLASSRREGEGDLQALCGIYEWQQQPLAFLVDGRLIGDAKHLQRIRRLLAMRGGAPYLAVVKDGGLTVYGVALDSATARASEVKLPADVERGQTFSYLSNTRPGTSSRRRWIEQVVLSLLDDAITRLIKECSLPSEQAISFVGRALFTRFLADRELLSDAEAQRIADVDVSELFDTADSIVRVNAWLDKTFNGDLLPLPAGVARKLGAAACTLLGNILRRAPAGQLHLDWHDDWAYLDFAFIPVGVLSQAYEHFLRSHQSERQEKEGGFYTPAPIAHMLLRGAMHALRAEGRADSAKVLDPAAGAGVFLISAFRQLVAEKWNTTGVRPDTKALRSILYQQIAGFDVNEAALRFAALGLYLISIELDPNPRPVQKLRFALNLRDRVLFKVGEQGSAGSLGRNVGQQHDGQYDLVTGNPPWSSSTQLADWSEIEAVVQEVASARLEGVPLKPRLPNEVMDLPFVWRAMRWCREGGQIAFALHARMLFQQGDGMPEARNAIFSALDVTGIVNGADLRNSRVWPDVAAAFCLLFARNARPTPASSFRFVSPRREDRLNAAGMFRIDASSAPQLTPTQLIEQPDILKVLYRGGQMDLELLRRMVNAGESVDSFWRSRLGQMNGKATWSGNGYQRLRPSSRVYKKDGKKGEPAQHLLGLPHLTSAAQFRPLLAGSDLPKFAQERVHHARARNLYQGPLLVVHQSPPAYSGRLNVAVSDGDVVYNESFYGYSAKEHERGHELVRVMALFIGSKPALWYSLMTSGKFGFEREVVEKSVVDSMMVPNFESMSKDEVGKALALFDELAGAVGEALEQKWAEVDQWVTRAYGLRESDVEVIRDSLAYGAPFSENREAAQRRPEKQDVQRFLETLKGTLEPFAQRFGMTVTADRMELPVQQPWLMFRLCASDKVGPKHSDAAPDVEPLLRMADGLGTTEVVVPQDDGSLLVARLDQSRYWAPTQARLFARRMVWEQRQHLFGTSE